MNRDQRVMDAARQAGVPERYLQTVMDALTEEHKADIARQHLLAQGAEAVHHVVRNLLPLDPEVLVDAWDPEQRQEMHERFMRIRDWCDRMDRALNRQRLRVIPTGDQGHAETQKRQEDDVDR